jgi:hypothetical protein
MSSIIPANIKIPTHLANRVGSPSVLAQSLTGGLSGGGEAYPRISIKGARFRIIDGDTETVLDSTTLEAVIVGANPRLSKTWYAKQWTPDAEPSAPDCFSLDGIGPDPQSTKPQNDLCASCPQNAWGSKVTPQGQEIKACADQKRLAIVAADDPSGAVYLLQVTPAALKGLNQYQKELAVRGIPPEIVKTKLSFDTDASFPKLKFSFGGFLDEETQTVVDELFGSEKVKDITGETPRRPVTPPQVVAPKQQVKSVEYKPEPAPVAEKVEEIPAPAPAAAKRGFGASKSSTPKAAKTTAPKTTAAPAAAPSASSLADEIAALVGEASDD